MNIKDNNHSFKTTRPLSGREVRISTIHHNLGQKFKYVPHNHRRYTGHDQKKGWAYPNLSYREAMTMLQEIKCPEILGKELDNCVVAWKEARKTQTMFNQISTHQNSLKYPTETDFLQTSHVS